MKKTLLALSLISTVGVMADQAPSDRNQKNRDGMRKENYREGRRDDRYMDENNDPCACPPCCPVPKPCIDCESYVPSYYDLQCAWGTSIEVDFLYWFMRENNMPYALEFINNAAAPGTSSNLVLSPESYQYLNTKWSPGFRVGLGWETNCDGWDLNLVWTWNKNRKRNTFATDFYSPTSSGNFDIPAQDARGIINPWVNAGVLGDPTSSANQVMDFTSVQAKWRLTFNQIDLEFGKRYWLSRHFTMRPYAGVRGAWTKTRFETLSLLETGIAISPAEYRNFSDQFKDTFWGVGLLAGFQPTWYFNCRNTLGVYANFDASLIYGKYRSRKSENYLQESISLITGVPTVGVNYSNQSINEFFMMEPIIDLALGFTWTDTWNCDRFRTSLDIGWEHHVWFNNVHRMITQFSTFDNGGTQGAFRGYDSINSDLQFGGLVIRAKFEF